MHYYKEIETVVKEFIERKDVIVTKAGKWQGIEDFSNHDILVKRDVNIDLNDINEVNIKKFRELSLVNKLLLVNQHR
jgi:hypothetical protein